MVVEVLRNETYIVDGSRLGRIKGAINVNSLQPFIKSKYIAPDATTQNTLKYLRVDRCKKNFCFIPPKSNVRGL